MRRDEWLSRVEPRPDVTLPSSTAEWVHLPPRYVSISALTPTQDCVFSLRQATLPFSGDFYPHAVAVDSKLFVLDGHHRVVAAIERGDETTFVRVWTPPLASVTTSSES